jgi:nitroreductase
MKDVTRLLVTPGGITLSTLFEPPTIVQAVLQELDFHKHSAILAAAPTVTPSVPQWILQRRSIREYTRAPVTDEQIDVLLQSAMAAPSANDVRPWAFVVVRDPARRQALAQTHQWSGMCAQAPVVFAVLGNPDRSDHWVEDCSAATENLLLTAAALGLGGVWVAIYPRPQREAYVRQALDIPEAWRVLCLAPVGKPAETKSPRTRYEASKVHFDLFGT